MGTHRHNYLFLRSCGYTSLSHTLSPSYILLFTSVVYFLLICSLAFPLQEPWGGQARLGWGLGAGGNPYYRWSAGRTVPWIVRRRWGPGSRSRTWPKDDVLPSNERIAGSSVAVVSRGANKHMGIGIETPHFSLVGEIGPQKGRKHSVDSWLRGFVVASHPNLPPSFLSVMVGLFPAPCPPSQTRGNNSIPVK